jgi:flagellar biosynthesis/type III secretory pathway M-ring protein FliF/YscJ
LSWVELIPFAFVAIGFVILFRVLRPIFKSIRRRQQNGVC